MCDYVPSEENITGTSTNRPPEDPTGKSPESSAARLSAELRTGRKIIHADCDSFFASVEMRDDPTLRDQPVAVGGSPDKRGVVATCNYEARRFGIHSAMPMSRAIRLCPKLVIVRSNIEKYKQVSGQIREIFERFTDIIEPLSLDEAFLDVTATQQCQRSATRMAEVIRRSVREELGITISCGIGPNKFVAKIASDWNKPDGQFTVTPAQVDTFVADLPVEKIFGVGSVTAARMHNTGIRKCSDLRQLSLAELTRSYGKFGARLHNLCRGQDERPVRPHRLRKSISVERTFAQDLPDLESALDASRELFRDLQNRIDSAGAKTSVSTPRSRIDQCFVKVRFSDFSTTTVSSMKRLCELEEFEALISEGWARASQPVRLLGLGVRLAHPDSADQLALFGD